MKISHISCHVHGILYRNERHNTLLIPYYIIQSWVFCVLFCGSKFSFFVWPFVSCIWFTCCKRFSNYLAFKPFAFWATKPDEGYYVPDEGYSSNVPDEGYSSNVPDEGYYSNVPDEGYSRNASCALNLISTFLSSKYNLYMR